jgi:type II restriction/modification system DNA methylase subunit YeeA
VSPEQFIKKWTASDLSERSAAQQHFLDLCLLLGEPTPAEADPTGETFTFEKGGTTATGGHGWADVWKKGVFAWEYKGPGKDLKAAYLQLKNYADMLENPPLLITSDTKRIEIHTNFTSTVKTVVVLELVDLSDPAKREILRAAFTNPEKLRPGVTRQQVTKEAAERFSQLAHHLQAKGYNPQRVAHFLNRIIFCMFAEDVGLLPNRIFTKLATAAVAHPETFEANARQLFAGMAKGGSVAFEVIDWFDGGLFDDDSTLPLDKTELQLVLKSAELDWSNIEPSIFGTLFERGLDPDKRSQQGAHYTDPETIMKIVGPVVLDPWVREWETERATLAKQVDRAKRTVSEAAKQRYYAFLERLANFKVLDPACGSGNFLYLALRGLKSFEKRVIHDAEALGLPQQFPRVGPEAVLGIEVNPYAAELARVTIWIGELQWMLENGFTAARNPILKPLDQIECRDAILNTDGSEPEWPMAHAVVGNPPFLGDKKLVRGLGREYVDALRKRYAARVPGGADLCCYWFDKLRSQIADGDALRGGLVATDNIRSSPKNRRVLEAIGRDLVIFDAWTDQDWVNEGAAVRVSLISCAKDAGLPAHLNGALVRHIHTDLSSGQNTDGSEAPSVAPLPENSGKAFSGVTKKGSFNIPGDIARAMLLEIAGPNGRKNFEVLFPWKNGDAITGRDPDAWIISFGELDEHEAAMFTSPYEHVRQHVLPTRVTSTSPMERRLWWQLARRAQDLFAAINGLSRFLVTPEVSKHRVFVWLSGRVMPDKNLVAIARDDDVSFGILQSIVHSLWALRVGTRLEDRPRYTSTTTFRSFPFPPRLTPDIAASAYEVAPAAVRIAGAAAELNKLRDRWLNPPELVERVPEVVSGYPDRVLPRDASASEELKKRTMTHLYNANPAWLQHAHNELDEAVAAAYGWQWPLSDEEILKRLFALNRERAAPLLAESVVGPTSRSRSAKAVRRQPR